MTKLTEDLYILKKKLLPQGVFCPCPEAVYMCMIIIFKQTFLETARPIKAKPYMEPSWKEECKFCENGLTHMTKMAAMPIYGKIFSRI